jgi:hypothetical protein
VKREPVALRVEQYCSCGVKVAWCYSINCITVAGRYRVRTRGGTVIWHISGTSSPSGPSTWGPFYVSSIPDLPCPGGLTVSRNLVPRFEINPCRNGLSQWTFVVLVILAMLIPKQVSNTVVFSSCSSGAPFPAFYGTWRCFTALTTASPVRVPGHMDPVRALQPCFPKIHFNIILPSALSSSNLSLSFRRFNQNVVLICHLSMRSTWLPDRVVLDLISFSFDSLCYLYMLFIKVEVSVKIEVS